MDEIIQKIADIYYRIERIYTRLISLEYAAGYTSLNLPVFQSVASARSAVVSNTYRRFIVVNYDEENLDIYGNPQRETIYYKSSTILKRIDNVQIVEYTS